MRIALIGDGESPHLLKWARALAASPGVALWVASSRGFLPAFDAVVPPERRLALGTASRHAGGSAKLLLNLPKLGAWLRHVDADWLNAHYLTSHGTLAWLAKRLWRLRAQILGSAWGSDILVTPRRSRLYRWLTQRVLRACALSTSDSLHMAQRMRELGATEVMTFPFGLESLPEVGPSKQPWRFFANRALEPIYRPERVLEMFSRIAKHRPDARLIVANDGALLPVMRTLADQLQLAHCVEFVGRLGPADQAVHYDLAQWYLSLPESDSVAVSVLEAMAHGCIPLLSDLPANRELVCDGRNGLILRDAPTISQLEVLLAEASRIARENHEWIRNNALFAPSVERLLARLFELDAPCGGAHRF